MPSEPEPEQDREEEEVRVEPDRRFSLLDRIYPVLPDVTRPNEPQLPTMDVNGWNTIDGLTVQDCLLSPFTNMI